MNKMRAWVRNYFGFSRTETNAFLILLPLMMVVVFAEPAFEYWYTRQPQDFDADIKMLDSALAHVQWEEKERKDSASHHYTTTRHPSFFLFNPNQTTKEEFVQLGFPHYLTQRVINYRQKGGTFSIKSDLLKIYQMDTSFYERLYPYIDLPEQKEAHKNITSLPSIKKETIRFDINLADTVELSSIYGIGVKLSARIMKYREKVGGFVALSQLHDVYGLDSTVVTELKNRSYIAPGFQPRQLSINTATEKELASHPYIKYTLAKIITAYRFQHGPYQSVDDLKKIALLDEPLFQKIKPYISLNP